MKLNLFQLRSRGLSCLALALCALAAAGPRVALAEIRTSSLYMLDLTWDSAQIPDTGWQLMAFGGMPSAYQLSDGSWALSPGERFTIQILPVNPATTPETRALGHVDLLLQFKGPQVLQLDANTSVRTDLVPGEFHVTTTSIFGMPGQAQLATSHASDLLQITAAGSEVQTSALTLLPSTPATFSQNRIGDLRWASMPAGAGAWQLSLDQRLTGANYLLPSDDPDCAGVACMPSQRGAAGLQQLTFELVTRSALVPTAPVPEPASQALLVGGLLAIAALRRRLRGRSAQR